MENVKYKILLVKSKEWLKAKREANEKTLVDILSNSPAVVFVYVNKDEKHPEKWAIASIIDVSNPSIKDVLDKVARELGYPEGVLSKEFLRKHLKDNCLKRLASY